MSLTKKTKLQTIKQAAYTFYRPGYSVPNTGNSGDPKLTLAGLDYVIQYLRARGYNAVQGITIVNSTTNVVGVWHVRVNALPKKINLTWIWLTPDDVPISANYLELNYNAYYNFPAIYTERPETYITKQVPDIGWNGGATSISKFVGKGYGEFSVSKLVVGVFVGLSKKRIAIEDSHYINIEYSIYTHLGNYACYVNGVKKSDSSTYISSDVFKIEITSNQVNYYKNGVLFFSVPKQIDFEEYVLDSSLYYSGDTVTNVSIVQDPNLIEFVFEIPLQEKILTQQDLFIEFPISIGIDFTLDNTIPLDFVFTISLVSNIFPKDYIGLDCTIPLESSIEIGTEVPYIPFNLVVEIPITGYIRDNYIYPVQMFVIT